MAKQKSHEGNFVKKETVVIVALIALVIGFLGGVFYSAVAGRGFFLGASSSLRAGFIVAGAQFCLSGFLTAW